MFLRCPRSLLLSSFSTSTSYIPSILLLLEIEGKRKTTTLEGFKFTLGGGDQDCVKDIETPENADDYRLEFKCKFIHENITLLLSGEVVLSCGM